MGACDRAGLPSESPAACRMAASLRVPTTAGRGAPLPAESEKGSFLRSLVEGTSVCWLGLGIWCLFAAVGT